MSYSGIFSSNLLISRLWASYRCEKKYQCLFDGLKHLDCSPKAVSSVRQNFELDALHPSIAISFSLLLKQLEERPVILHTWNSKRALLLLFPGAVSCSMGARKELKVAALAQEPLMGSFLAVGAFCSICIYPWTWVSAHRSFKYRLAVRRNIGSWPFIEAASSYNCIACASGRRFSVGLRFLTLICCFVSSSWWCDFELFDPRSRLGRCLASSDLEKGL